MRYAFPAATDNLISICSTLQGQYRGRSPCARPTDAIRIHRTSRRVLQCTAVA